MDNAPSPNLSQEERDNAPLTPLPEVEGNVNYRGGFYFSGLVETARELRQKQTPAEEIFWELVRNKKFNGLKFRRQHQIGNYVVDFYCHSEKIVIEFDGEVHNTEEQQAHDKKRDAYLTSIGNIVLRFENKELLNDPRKVLTKIANNLSPTGRDVREGKQNKVLFIDARQIGSMIDRTHKELTEEDIKKIAKTYHDWRSSNYDSSSRSLGEMSEGQRGYMDIPGYCKSATLDDIQKNDYVLTPGRYVGAAPIEDSGIPFETKMTEMSQTLYAQMEESTKLDDVIRKNLEGLGYGECEN
jgi:very-short-patch-repair endonuclease